MSNGWKAQQFAFGVRILFDTISDMEARGAAERQQGRQSSENLRRHIDGLIYGGWATRLPTLDDQEN